MTTLSALREAKHADIQTHRIGYGGPGRMAVNVKYRGRYPDCSEDVGQSAWERVTDDFWDQARDIAREHGYDNVFSEGRSGGWLIPFYQPSARRGYHGQGGNLGYPTFPDDESLIDRATFLAFERDIEALMADVPAMLADAVHDIEETAREYPA